jgi:hypothetical protein
MMSTTEWGLSLSDCRVELLPAALPQSRTHRASSPWVIPSARWRYFDEFSSIRIHRRRVSKSPANQLRETRQRLGCVSIVLTCAENTRFRLPPSGRYGG